VPEIIDALVLRRSAVRAALLWGAGCLSIALSVGWIITRTGLIGGSVVSLVVWIGVLLFLALAPIRLLPVWARRGSELGVIYACIWALVFGLASLTWVGERAVVGAPLQRQQITASVALMALGIGCFWIGYLWIRWRLGPPHRAEPAFLQVSWTAITIGYIVGAGISVYLLAAGQSGLSYALPQTLADNTLRNTLYLLTFAAPVATYISFISTLRSGSYGAKVASIIFVVGLSALGAASGSKWATIEPPFFLVLIYAFYRGQLPKRWIISGVVILLLVIVPGNLVFRSQITYTTQQSDLVGASQLAALAGGLSLSQRASLATQWLGTRLASIDTIGLITTQTPTPNPYEHGRLWILAPVYNSIPRLLWPSKPVLDLEYNFDRVYRHLPPDVVTNTGLTEPGDLYINFGLPGVAVGMFILGLLFAWVAKSWLTPVRPRMLIVSMLILDQVLLMEHSISGILLSLPRIALAGYVASRFMMTTGAAEESHELPVARRGPEAVG
jgi:hypothetical protein